jgi:bifunctional N-acetylglucosamine-1-phosphate-uridyltransferase/glucosamine-1-phosphate-acetyltransferase GlmU-like protein
METITLKQVQNELVYDDKDIDVLLFICNQNLSIYDEKVLNLSIKEWVLKSINKFKVKEVNYNLTDNIIDLARKNVDNDSKITLILFADTPLLSYECVNHFLNDIIIKNKNYIKLPRGIVCKTSYLKNNENFDDYVSSTIFNDEFITVFSQKDLPNITNYLKQKIIDNLVQNGVIIKDTTLLYIDATVNIESGVTIYGNNYILGNTSIFGKETIIYPNNYIEDATIYNNSKIGPFSRIRSKTIIGENCKIGNFVEIKNSIIGSGTKIAHLTYVGDGTIGKNCNFGCGTVLCNYDGVNKNKTIVGDNVFIGSNVNLIAPITIGDNSFIAAGSTIYESLPKDSFAIARSYQVVKKRKKK